MRAAVVALIVDGLRRLDVHRLRLVVDRWGLDVDRLRLDIDRLLNVNRTRALVCDDRTDDCGTDHRANYGRSGTPAAMSGGLAGDSQGADKQSDFGDGTHHDDSSSFSPRRFGLHQAADIRGDNLKTVLFKKLRSTLVNFV